MTDRTPYRGLATNPGFASFEVEAARIAISARLAEDTTYSVRDAMTAFSNLACEAVFGSLPVDFPGTAWIGGSLGRRELMPNSDLDVFVIESEAAQGSHASTGEVGRFRNLARGHRKFELGLLTTSSALSILDQSLVDANRLIDGYGLPEGSTKIIEKSIRDYSTSDRQLSNIITEYNYWHGFDFPAKGSKTGPNIKYSRGGSRVTIFFNWKHRLISGEFPLRLMNRPEIYTALARYRVPQDLIDAVDTILLVKDVATGFYLDGQNGSRFASARTMGEVYRHLRPRLHQQGLVDGGDFGQLYALSHDRLGNAVEELYQEILAVELPGSILNDIADASVRDLLELYLALESDTTTLRPRSLAALVAWTIVKAGGGEAHLQVLLNVALSRSISSVWGVILAIICSANVSDDLLRQILSWLDANETGAYLSKVISRSRSASDATRSWARASYVARERIYQLSGGSTT